MIEVKGHPNLVRDPTNDAILSIDKERIAKARQLKAQRQKERAEKDALLLRIESLETSLTEINSALQILINRD